MAVVGHLVVGGDEDVDVLVVGAVAHHCGEVRVVGTVHDEDRSQVTVRQVVLVFDDVDFTGAAAGVA